MNKPLLLCLLMVLWGQVYAQKTLLKNFKEAQAVELNRQGVQASGLEKNKLIVPLLLTNKPDKIGNTTKPGKTDFPEYWPDRIFVKLKNGQNSQQLTFDKKATQVKAPGSFKLNKTFQGYQVTKFSELTLRQKNTSGRNVYELVVKQPGQLQQMMQELNSLPEVAYVERVPYYVALDSPNDPAYLDNSQYALHKTKAAEAYGIHTGNAKTLLAIVDDAVLVSHPDLAANINTAKSYDVADQDSDPRPPSSGANKAGTGNFSHGTHCAGIAGAVTDNGTGVAAISKNKVSIIGVKCTRDAAPSSRVIEYATEGIVYAINQGAKVISMSFGGGGYSQTIQNIINEATANGVVFVAAAGNDNTEREMYPAAYENVIAVASTDANDLKSGFSNFGTWVDVSAPGTGILSTVTAADGLSGAYTNYSGTSMACPMVASLVAYMLSQNPNLTPQAVTQLLKNSADSLENIPNQSPALAGKMGAGRINAYRAIQAVKGIANAVAPEAITNLHLSRTGQTDIEIQWSAPDAGGKPAALYDIRFSPAPITVDDFEAAANTKESIFPAEPGVSQSLIIKGLVPGTTYYIAIIAKSFYGNASPLSNVAHATTQAAPRITVNSSSNNLTLNRTNGNTGSTSFTISNSGAADLNYHTTIMPLTGSNILSYDKPQQSADNSVGLGGESFISAAKFVAGAGGFNLTHVQNFLVCSFTTSNVSIGVKILKGGTSPANATLLTAQTFSTVIPAGGSFFNFPLQASQQMAAGEVFWVAFDLPTGVDFPQGFDELGSLPNTFFLSIDNGGSYEDAQTLASFLSNAAFKIRVANADWATLSPTSGSVLPGQASEVTLNFNSSKIPDGFYQMQALFHSNDPYNPVIKKPVDLTVMGGQPKFWMEPAEVDFGNLFVGASKTIKVTVANKGTATLEITPEDLNLDPYTTDDFDVNVKEANPLPPGTQQEVLVTFTPSKDGVLNGTATLSSNDSTAIVITVPIKATVGAPPVAEVTPTSLSFEMNFSGATTATNEVQVLNKGVADLDYSLQALVDPIAEIGYHANRQPDNYLGFGAAYPYLHTALKFNVTNPTFNLTHVQDFIRTEVAGNKKIILKVYKGGNLPTSGSLLLQQTYVAPASAANGGQVTLTLQQPQQFKQGDVFWVVLYYEGLSKPQGYQTNTPNPGRNYFSSNGANWYALESAGGILTSSTYVIKALEMPQWLSITSGTSVMASSDTYKVTTGNQTPNLVRVNTAGLPKGRYNGKIQVHSNDPKKPFIIIEVSMVVEEVPVAKFSAELKQVLPGEQVTFLNLSEHADAYEWHFEGAEPVSSTLINPTVIYSKPGKYKVSLIAKNTQTGRTSEKLVKEKYIVVSNTLCQELNSSFKSNVSLATTTGGYPTGNNSSNDLAKVNYFNYNRPNAYITGMKLKFGHAQAADPNAKIKIAIWDKNNVEDKPGNIIAFKEVKLTDVAVDVSAGRTTDILLDAPVQLTGSFYVGVILNNEPGNSLAIFHNANSETTPGIAWSQDNQQNWKPFGANWPNLADIALYIQPTITQTLTTVQADFTISSESVCVGEQVEFDASATIGALRYEWFLEGATETSSTELKPHVSYTNPGTYKIILKAFDACSGVVVISKNITINSLPDAAINVSGPTTLCDGEKVTLSAVPGENYSYIWSNGAKTRSIEVGTAGNYSVIVTNAQGCSNTAESVKIIINTLPIASITADGPTTFCAGDKVILRAPAGEGYNYRWSNGAITQAIEVNTTGPYSVTVKNTSGCESTSAAMAVTVNDLPGIDIIANGPTEFCNGGSVLLMAPAGNGYKYNWSNGATTRSIRVEAAGDYQVTITNAFGCNVTSDPVRVSINPLPVAAITSSGPTTFCQGERVILTASVGENYAYRWSNGATTRSIEVSNTGDYTVTVINAAGCEAISPMISVRVNQLPTATIIPNGPTTFCAGESVTLTASEGSGYLWSNGATTRQITINTGGDYRVIVTNAAGCQAISAITKVVVNLLPVATITPGGATRICQGENITLTASEGAGYIYLWSNSATSRSITVNTSDTYRVTITNATGCSATSEAVKVEVNPLPVATITAGGPTTICKGERVTLTATTGGGYTYRWSNGATTRSIEVGTAGEYAVTVTNTQGCTVTSAPIEVKVNALPNATITASGPTTFCQGNQVVLTASEGSNYLWSNGAITRSITVSGSGSYSVRVMNSNGCTNISEEVKTIMNLLPEQPSISRKDVILTSSSASGNQWFRNNTAIQGAYGVLYDATQPGVYQIRVTNANGCVTEMSEEIIVTEDDLITDFKAYPNPGNGNLILDFTGLKPEKVSLRIFNALGKVVYENLNYTLVSREFPINITQVAAGVYILQVQHNGRNYNRRIVVQH